MRERSVRETELKMQLVVLLRELILWFSSELHLQSQVSHCDLLK